MRESVLDETEAGTLGAWRDALRAAIDVDDFAPELRYRIDEPAPPQSTPDESITDAPAATSDETPATATEAPERPNSRV